MIEKNVREKINKLTEELKKYNEFYYNKNTSIISDVEYDNLVLELKKLEEEYPELAKEDSPLLKVGSSCKKENKFKKVKHKLPMLSLSNSYNATDIEDFVSRVKKNIINKIEEIDFALELKLDGLSISVFYEDGILKKAVTRGDGQIGEDVTENILAIKNITKKLNEKVSLEVRGEVVMPLTSFISLNEKRLAQSEEIFANPRNAAAGTLRQLDANIVAERNLDAYFYFLVDAEKYNLKKHSESIKYLEKLGIKTTKICEVIKDSEKIVERINFWSESRKKMDYETDGMVIKLNNLDLWEEVGYTAKSPRWAIAYKFPAEQVTTILKDVTWQVGRTGKLTPVAELEEVFLSGSTVRRASLHNFSEIKRKDILIGDRVFIEKAAEIIPQVVKSVKELRTGNEKEVLEPINCPVCDSKLVREYNLVDIFCKNPHCPSKIQGYIEYFVSRDAMNISGMGSKIVEKFIELNFIKDVTDIYNLKNHKEKLINLEKMGEKSIENLLNSIEESKKRDYDKVIYSLGIPYVGKVGAKILAKESKNIENLMNLSYEDLLNIEGIGDIVAKEILNYFAQEENKNTIKKLKEMGLKFEIEITENKKENLIFEGKTFLATGSLIHYKRDEIREDIERHGGKYLSSVSKNLNYLIVGENAGSKLEKAEKLDVKILTEEEYDKLKTNLTK